MSLPGDADCPFHSAFGDEIEGCAYCENPGLWMADRLQWSPESPPNRNCDTCMYLGCYCGCG